MVIILSLSFIWSISQYLIALTPGPWLINENKKWAIFWLTTYFTICQLITFIYLVGVKDVEEKINFLHSELKNLLEKYGVNTKDYSLTQTLNAITKINHNLLLTSDANRLIILTRKLWEETRIKEKIDIEVTSVTSKSLVHLSKYSGSTVLENIISSNLYELSEKILAASYLIHTRDVSESIYKMLSVYIKTSMKNGSWVLFISEINKELDRSLSHEIICNINIIEPSILLQRLVEFGEGINKIFINYKLPPFFQDEVEKYKENIQNKDINTQKEILLTFKKSIYWKKVIFLNNLIFSCSKSSINFIESLYNLLNTQIKTNIEWESESKSFLSSYNIFAEPNDFKNAINCLVDNAKNMAMPHVFL